MVEQTSEQSVTTKRPHDRCTCGRFMGIVISVDQYNDEGFQVRWCDGCGVVSTHFNDGSPDEWFVPNPKFIGVP